VSQQAGAYSRMHSPATTLFRPRPPPPNPPIHCTHRLSLNNLFELEVYREEGKRKPEFLKLKPMPTPPPPVCSLGSTRIRAVTIVHW
jgi:hypothetical protein